MDEVSFTVSLRVFHPSSSHESIAAAMRMEADFGNTVGEPRMTPAGRPIGGTNKHTYCCFTLLPKKCGIFEDGLIQILSELKPHADFLRAVTDVGGRVELFVGVFADGSTGFTLPLVALSDLANLTLEFSVEIYC